MNRNSMFKVGLYTCIGLGSLIALATGTPQWWTDQGVLNANSAQDEAAANQGQLKYMALKASEECQGQFPLLDLSEIEDLVSSFNASNNLVAVNLGQLKYVAQPFYDVLASHLLLTNAWPAGMVSGPYPWSGSGNASQDDALANLGQLKYIFSMGLDSWYSSADSDGDGLPDDWETVNGLSSASHDSDGDGMADGWEILHGFDPLIAADGLADEEPDGLTNAEEFERQTDPHTSTPDGVLVVIPATGTYQANEPNLVLTLQP